MFGFLINFLLDSDIIVRLASRKRLFFNIEHLKQLENFLICTSFGKISLEKKSEFGYFGQRTAFSQLHFFHSKWYIDTLC